MRLFMVAACVACLVGSVCGQDLGNRIPPVQMPVKASVSGGHQPSVNPRQGGDTVFDATPIGGLPFQDSGTTVGYADDYAFMCPYGSWAPDAVYSFVAVSDMGVDVDLCGSLYDTAIFVLAADLSLVACNDDYYFDDICGYYVSKVVNVELEGGSTYFIVIDGYTDDSGDYELEVVENLPCELDCPDSAILEGEPELMDGYVDEYNGGCNTDASSPLEYVQTVQEGEFCGVSGWYDGGSRDTDWFEFTVGYSGSITWHCDAEQTTNMFEILNMPDCDAIEVGQSAVAEPCIPASMTVYGDPESVVYLWIGPADYYPPPGFVGHEYDYVCNFDAGVVATENATWSRLKAMYR